MRKVFLSFLGLAMMASASAQLSAGVNANYTMYKGDFQKSTPGAQIRIGYEVTEKATAVLSFTYGMPIKTPSEVTMQDNFGSTSTVPSEINFKFKTFNLVGHYTFIGDQESLGKFYGIAGIGFVMVSYDETIKGSYDKNAYTPMDQVNGKTSGLTINVGLGGQYKFGAPAIFAEAGVGLPANQANGQYIDNPIPTHIILNLGVKLDLGGSN